MSQESPVLDVVLSAANSQPGQRGKPSPPQRIILTHSKDWWSIGSEFALIGGSLAVLGYMFHQLFSKENTTPEATQKQVAEHMKAKLIARMKKSGRNIRSFNTNSYEDSLLDMIVLPQQIEVRFNDIGGLDNIKRDLTETVLVPLMYPQLTCSSRLCQPPLGVLFYGPPGTGKSMMAKAIARETNATFINVDMSRLMSKWYGDSQKYISALFSLARKMAPSIIWIDEIDALFSQRSRSDHSADVYNKALFLSLWDGLANDIYQSNLKRNNNKNINDKNNKKYNNYNHSNNLNNNNKNRKKNKKSTPYGSTNKFSKNLSNSNSVSSRSAGVMVLGATNRPQEVDEAFLRRMSRQYEYIMPDLKTRSLILNILLQYENCDESINIERISQLTNNYSGSDLKELCKYAATLPLREYIRTKASDIDNFSDNIFVKEKTPNGYNNNNNNNSSNSTNDINTVISNECTEIFKELNNGSMIENEENINLRSITMKDFEVALEHIKSTMQAHNQHKERYSKGSLHNMLDPFLSGISNFGIPNRHNINNNNNIAGGSNSRRSRYSGPPTVSSRQNSSDSSSSYINLNDKNDNNNNTNNNNNGNKNNSQKENIRAAGEAVDPLCDIDLDVE